MEDKYKEIIDELLYNIGEDIISLLDKDCDDIVDAILNLHKNVNELSSDIYNDKIVYKRPEGKADFTFSLK